MGLATIDIAVLGVYAVFIFFLAQWVSREKAGHEKNAKDYFLAGRSLPWWAIGASLIAANISAEQIIGMAGSGYKVGLAIACYEWMAALTLILVGKFFLPIFLENQIYTMPQFLEQRYGSSVRLTLAVFWLGVYVFVNLASILWLGSIAVNAVAGVDQMTALVVLGVFSCAYSLFGGLKAVALTDIVQVTLLVLGGLIIGYLALNQISGGQGVLAGFHQLTLAVPEKFQLILTRDNPNYKDLPGISVLVGGLWVMNVSYWGFNQYIIQRALAAKSVREAQKGVVFAAFLKLLMPVIIVLPGLAALLLVPNLATPDQAYPEVMKMLPAGLKGLVFAALVAAIVASLASKINSVATIFTLDLYAHVKKDASQHHLVAVGRIVSVVAVIIGIVVAKPLLGNFDQAFQYIQEFTGFFTPGICVIFLLGMFWPRANAAGALTAAIGSAVLSLALKVWLPELPFIDRVGVTFLACLAAAVVVSLAAPALQVSQINVKLKGIDYSTSTSFNLAALVVLVIVSALYITWW
ncbi:sodium/sugar symporter [Nitrospirillum sp. BR 11752]|uniref:SSS family solute:Na+ symporter n=1 Tax=Nitrospirillum amazonense TaxID=28077 RepID=A0A560HBJ0_9PROT|nr:sodium/sugar symporter [Nitrospirillum amazonense]MEE3624803.1 sodium/sugar symporter [Nitrospirillum sp. BR 11752]TWB43471.1 SSS family solute:Na+ symporter [Nitrospirillum amazonense]